MEFKHEVGNWSETYFYAQKYHALPMRPVTFDNPASGR